MTMTERPYLTFQTRYMQLLAVAEEFNAAEIYVTEADWYVLLQCTLASGRGKDPEGRPSIQIGSRRFRPKLPKTLPSGRLDLTGAEPYFEP
jgi:hypothetical protein